MTDNDIMEALEYCTNPKVHKKCPRAKFVDVCNDGCIHLLMKQALDLINRQKAEIDALIAGQESLTNYINVLLEEKGGNEE